LALIYPLGLAIIKVVKETEWKILTCVGLIVIAVALILTKALGISMTAIFLH
jgi:hypothetical protein